MIPPAARRHPTRQVPLRCPGSAAVRAGGLRPIFRRGVSRPASAAAIALTVLGAVLVAPGQSQSKRPALVSYKKQIAPILGGNCNACHSGSNAQSGISTATYESLMKGGKRGRAVIPANGKASLLVQYLDGRKMPRMPIGGSLKPAEIALITRWIEQGAKSDGEAAANAAAPAPIKPIANVLPQAAALAWSGDGKRIAVGTYRVVELFSAETGRREKTLTGHTDVVRSLAFSPNGEMLAAAGGVPGQAGEVKLWSLVDGKVVQAIEGHTDCIYGVAWRPDGRQLVTASYDKTLKIWDPATGKSISDLKDHADAVYACGYHANGKFMATGSADRSVRIWDPEKGTRIYTLAGHTEMVTGIAFHPTAEQLVTGGADKAAKLWTLKADSGENTRTFAAQSDVITDVRFAPDGKSFATAANDGKVCLYDPGKAEPVKTIQASPDALLCIAFSPDSKRLAVGGYDGSVQVLELPEGKVALRLIAPPPPKAAAKPSPGRLR
jgi:mono/diheme cytochrome c family protein